jgi:Integrase core domain
MVLDVVMTASMCLFRKRFYLLKLVGGQPDVPCPNLFHRRSLRRFGAAFGEPLTEVNSCNLHGCGGCNVHSAYAPHRTRADHAAMEAFWSTLKLELVYRCRLEDHRQVRQALFDYIEVFFNRQRLTEG